MTFERVILFSCWRVFGTGSLANLAPAVSVEVVTMTNSVQKNGRGNFL